MNRLLDSFCRYARVDTMAVEAAKTYPSSPGQLELGRLLAEELRQMGAMEVEQTADGIVFATIPASAGVIAPTIALIAHVDTSPETSGHGVKPVVHAPYDGGDISYPAVPGLVLSPSKDPELARLKGATIITSDGTTLLGADDKAGVAVTDRGFINVDIQMRTNVPHIYAIGDIVGQPMLAHKAVHEGHVAAEAAHGEKAYFDAKQIPSVAYTDPEVAWAGLTEDQCKAQGIKYGKGVFPWAASGRAIANGRDEGFTKLIFDEETHRIIGGGIVGTHAGDLIGEVCLAIEMGADAVDIGKTIHPHPTLGESIGMAAEVAHGSCTDLPPSKR